MMNRFPLVFVVVVVVVDCLFVCLLVCFYQLLSRSLDRYHSLGVLWPFLSATHHLEQLDNQGHGAS